MEKERLSIKMQRHLRPLTATPKKKKLSSKDSEPRPNTASIAQSRGYNQRKSIVSNSLRKSHLQAQGRSPDLNELPETSSPELSLVQSSGGELELIRIVEEQNDVIDGSATLEEVTEAIISSSDLPRKRHPSFETWLSGSDHSSDEYDTDVEGDNPETPAGSHLSDASGRLEYEEQCRKHGFVPIAYLCRHIGERNLRMRHRYLGGSATKPLALAFKHNTVTENLDLSDNYIEGSGTNFLASMLKENHFIVSLNLSNNFIGSSGAEAIAEMLEINTTLKMLSLSGNQLSDKDAVHLINPIKNNLSLMSLDLSHNEFSVMGGIHLGGAFGLNEAIMDLDLSWNCLRKQGAVSIVDALKLNKTLEVLDLSWNGFGLEGAIALQKALQVNKTLKVLDLTNNRLDSRAAQKLALGLKKNTALETLILNMNPLGDQGIEQILRAAATHPCLNFLSMEEMGLTKANQDLIQKMEDARDMTILHGGLGGFNRNTAVANVMRMFTTFLMRHSSELRDLFQQQDKDGTGILQVDDIKLCLRSAGLSLTSRYLDLLIEDMDSTHTGNITYRNILSGEAFSEYTRRRPSRGFHLLSRAKLEDESDEG